MFCPKCGAAAADSARFCPKCGAALSAPPSSEAKSGSRLRMSENPAPVSAPEPVRIPSEPVPEKPLTDAGRHVAKKNREPMQSGSSIWLSALLVIAVLLAAAGAAGVCFSARSRTAPDEAVLEAESPKLSELMAEGNAAYSFEDYELALDFYLLASERFPQEPDVLCRLADTYYILEDDSSALQYYQMAIMLFGEDGTMPVLSAQNYYHLTED